jgi:hypothetical protein
VQEAFDLATTFGSPAEIPSTPDGSELVKKSFEEFTRAK